MYLGRRVAHISLKIFTEKINGDDLPLYFCSRIKHIPMTYTDEQDLKMLSFFVQEKQILASKMAEYSRESFGTGFSRILTGHVLQGMDG